MYAGNVGRAAANSSNSVGHEHEISADIPEWKKLLILKKRAAGSSGSGNPNTSGAEENKTSPYDPLPRSHSRVPISPASDVKSGLSAPAGHANKFAVVRPVKVEGEGEKVVIPFSISAGETPILASNTVTRIFGNINVELRNVHRPNSEAPDQNFEPNKMESNYPARLLVSPSSEPAYAPQDSDDENEDLQYGPGIVDKLRSRFLNMGRRSQRKPVVRRFSSLENLSDRNGPSSGRFSSNDQETHGNRQQFRTSAPNLNHRYGVCNVKKAQSMETLLIGNPEQHLLIANKPSRRVAPRNACVSGVRSQIARAAPSPSSCVNESTNVNGSKVNRRRSEYNRQVSAPNISEDELPKPDTVKHFKMMFESPSSGEKTSSNMKKTATQSPSSSVIKCAITSNTPTKTDVRSSETYTAKSSAKASPKKVSPTLPNGEIFYDWNGGDTGKDCSIPENNVTISPTLEGNDEIDGEKIKDALKLISDVPLSRRKEAITSDAETLSNAASTMLSPSCSEEESDALLEKPVVDCHSFQQVPFNASPPLSPKVTSQQFYPETASEQEEESSSQKNEEESEKEPAQGSRVNEPERQTTESNTRPHPRAESLSQSDGMVLASQDGDVAVPDTSAEMCVLQAGSPTSDDLVTVKPSALKKASTWQKPPPSTTSVVFDFRGKDVKPNISLNPAPFGCRPAKVARSKKRAGSPPRTGPVRINGDPQKDYSDDEDDQFDEMDIGAHLPAVSGIVFLGENVKIGKGAFLIKRNKNLTIQFDDAATSTYEYPSEATAADETSPTFPEDGKKDGRVTFDASEEVNGTSVRSTFSMASSGGLSSYTPNVLSSENDFQLGVSRSAHRHTPSPSVVSEPQPPATEDIVPADPEDTSGWSAAETSDILF